MRGLCVVTVLMAVSPRAFAEEAASPWADGVTAAQKADAERELTAGNALFLERKYADALARYEAAIAHWDHPAIRFNIVRCLIQLGRLPDAAQNLEAALRYGAAPLEDSLYTEALAYEKLLADRLAELTIACTQAGVTVTLDGQAAVTCPGRVTRQVAPGPHQLVGTHPQLTTRTLELALAGGAHREVTVTLEARAASARIEHRWPTWIPWVVVGGGVAVAAIGGAVRLSAAADRDSFDRFVASCDERPCSEDTLEELGALEYRSDARWKGALAAGTLLLGGAAVVTGGVLVYLNRGRAVYPASVERVGVTPVAGGAALTVGGTF